MPGFIKMKMEFDVIALLKAIRTSIHKFEPTRYKHASLQGIYQKYFLFKQNKLTNSNYLKGVEDHNQLIEDQGDTIGPVDDQNLFREKLRSIPPVDQTIKDDKEIYEANAQRLGKAKLQIKDKFLASRFSLNASRRQHRKLINDLKIVTQLLKTNFLMTYYQPTHAWSIINWTLKSVANNITLVSQ